MNIKSNSFDEVFEEIVDLFTKEDEDQKFIFLTGAAGTGKTTLLERVKIQVDKKKMVVAPTGIACLLYTSPSPRDPKTSRMPSSA